MPENIELPGASHNKTNQVERAVDTPADFTSPEELYKDLIAAIKKYHPSTDLSDIEKAYETARKAHEGQFRKSGEPYIIHPLCVAIILAELELDKESIIAGLLHDVVEDTVMTSEDVAKEFGDEVALLVDGVTKLTQLNYQHDKIEVQAENLRKMQGKSYEEAMKEVQMVVEGVYSAICVQCSISRRQSRLRNQERQWKYMLQ